jgi:hypothetical protein
MQLKYKFVSTIITLSFYENNQSTTCGPNIWSIQRKKLIQMRLDLEEMEFQPIK